MSRSSLPHGADMEAAIALFGSGSSAEVDLVTARSAYLHEPTSSVRPAMSERCHNLTLLRNLPEVPHVGAAVS